MEEVDIIEAWGFNDENWVHETIADEMRQTQEEEEEEEEEEDNNLICMVESK